MRPLRTLLLSILLTLGPAISEAATWYVMAGGTPNTTGPANSCVGSDVTAAVTAASNGDTVQIGAGTCLWVNLDNQGKAINIVGAGTASDSCGPATTTGGTCGAPSSGSQTIIHPKGGSYAFVVSESTNGTATFSNITVIVDRTSDIIPGGGQSVGDGAGAGPVLYMAYKVGGSPAVLHHITFQYASNTTTCLGRPIIGILANYTRGVIYRSKFIGPPASFSNGNGGCAQEPFQQNPNFTDGFTLWQAPSTIGMKDIQGNQNFYFEDNTFQDTSLQSADNSNGSRAVWRRNTFFNAGLANHGHDTGNPGARHAEYYDNVFNITDRNYTIDAANIRMRGGTGIVANNVFPAQNGQGQTLGSVQFSLFVLRSSNQGGCPGAPTNISYPWLYQHGWGWDGTNTADPNGQRQQIEPLYWFLNVKPSAAGGGASLQPGYFDANPDQCNYNPPGNVTSNYVQPNREYYIDRGEITGVADCNSGSASTCNNGVGVGVDRTTRPNSCVKGTGWFSTSTQILDKCTATNTWTNAYWQRLTYPHPLAQSGASTSATAAPSGTSTLSPGAPPSPSNLQIR
jgi:hypothetical protein